MCPCAGIFTVALLVFFAPRVIQNIANPFLWLLYFLCRSFICSNFLVRLTIKRLAMAPFLCYAAGGSAPFAFS